MSQFSKGLPVRRLYFKYKSNLYYVEADGKGRYSTPFTIRSTINMRTVETGSAYIFGKPAKEKWERMMTTSCNTKESTGVHDSWDLSPTELYKVLMYALRDYITHIEPWTKAEWGTLDIGSLEDITNRVSKL
jgi:hypothetical protein